MFSKKIFLSVLLLGGTLYALETVSDFATWTAASVGLKPTQDLSFSLEAQVRTKENSQVLDQFFTDAGIKYSLLSLVDLGVGIRVIRSNDNHGAKQGYDDSFKYYFDIAVENEVDRFSFKNRLRVQNKINITNSDEAELQVLRFKTAVNYNIKKSALSPSISGEVYYPYHKNAEIEKIRLGVGSDYKLKKSGKISAEYRYERDLKTPWIVNELHSAHIIFVSYNYTFKLY